MNELDTLLKKKFSSYILPNWFSLFIIFYFLYNILTLSFHQIPWFDEIWYASITDSFIKTGKFYANISPLYAHGKEYLLYGPLYFIFTSLSIKLFGWGIWQFRIINLLGGIGCIIIYFQIIKLYSISRIWEIIAVLAFSTDVIFTVNISSGRMDSLGLCFVLIASYLILINPHNNILYLCLAAICASLALLTTPRTGILMISLALVIISRLIKQKSKKSIINCLLALLCFLSLYYSWVYTKFGSITNYLDYFWTFSVTEDVTSIGFTSFVGGNFLIYKFQIPLLIYFLIANIYFCLIEITRNELKFICLINIVLFYFLVFDTGAYSVLVSPFINLSIFAFVKEKINSNKWTKYGVYFILFINLGYFSLRTATMLVNLPHRNYEPIDNFIYANIPQGSKVLGNDQYFYSAQKLNLTFQTIDRGGKPDERLEYHLNIFKPQYLIISDLLPDNIKKLSLQYIKEGGFVKLASYKSNGTALDSFFKKINFFGSNNFNYSGTIYYKPN